MEDLVIFLATQTGQILSGVLLFMGVVFTPLERMVFNKAINKIEQEISPVMSPVEREPIEKRIEGIKRIMMFMTLQGLAFVAFGIFGLTR